MNAARFDACLRAPFAVLGIRTRAGKLTHIEFLPPATPLVAPRGSLGRAVVAQLQAYLRDPAFRFDLPLDLGGTPHQRSVWRELTRIPRGVTRTYGDLARRIGSAPRAVGQACGANPVPIVIPCHRVVGAQGLGGFMGYAEGDPIAIKQWLLKHEGWAR